MTVEQEVAQRVAELEERRKARVAGVRLEAVRKLALGILDLLDMTTKSTGEEIPIKRVDVCFDKEYSQISIVASNKQNRFTEFEDNEEIACKIRELTGNPINRKEDEYLRQLLKKYRRVSELKELAFMQFIGGKGFFVE